MKTVVNLSAKDDSRGAALKIRAEFSHAGLGRDEMRTSKRRLADLLSEMAKKAPYTVFSDLDIKLK